MSDKTCHICNEPAITVCRDCDRPVCKGCLAQMTATSCIDYDLCTDCDDNDQMSETFGHFRE